MTYSVFCYRFKEPAVKLYSNLSLEDAQKICKDPDTSSQTTKDWKLLKKWGPDHWFYGYEKD